MPELVYTPASRAELTSPLRRVYLLAGEDDHQKDEAIELIRSAALDPGFADFDCEVIDAQGAGVEQILAAACLAPFASPARLVVVRGAELLRRRERQADADRLAQGIAALGSSSCLVLRVAADDETARAKTALSAKVDTAVREAGLLVRCKALSAENLLDWLVVRARAAGKQLRDEAGERLIQAAHGDRTALENELEKAICFVGDRPAITAADVDAVCSYDAEDVMFRLVDAVSQRNADRALYLLRESLRYDSKPQSVAGRLLSLLARQYRLLWQARELIERRIEPQALRALPAEIAEELPAEGSITQMAWKSGELYRAARGWSRESLAGAFERILECDLNNKGGGEGSEDVVANLEILLISLCAGK